VLPSPLTRTIIMLSKLILVPPAFPTTVYFGAPHSSSNPWTTAHLRDDYRCSRSQQMWRGPKIERVKVVDLLWGCSCSLCTRETQSPRLIPYRTLRPHRPESATGCNVQDDTPMCVVMLVISAKRFSPAVGRGGQHLETRGSKSHFDATHFVGEQT
jgi:hypothetical protein